MLKRLIFFLLFTLMIFMLITSCSPRERKSDEEEEDYHQGMPTAVHEEKALDVFIDESEDAGQEYIDSFIFLGESTTYHLKSRGVLNGGSNTLQVWAPKSGTLMLSPSVAECRIVYPETNEEIDLSTALMLKKPKYIMFTFGLNGAVSNFERGKDYFKTCYAKLVDTVKEISPNTKIILQSCFPIAKNMDLSTFGVDASTLNEYIDVLNSWTAQLANEKDIGFLDSSYVFKDSNGFLREDFQVGDGYHLNEKAYQEMLKFMRTHAYEVK